MLDLLDEATSTRNLQVKLLPIIKSNNIIGAELLLRLKDDSKNVLVNTNELINVAIKNNRIGIITDIIIPMQKHFITPTHLVWVVPGMIGRQIIVCR